MSVVKRLYNDIFDALENSSLINTVLDFNEQYIEDSQDQYNLVKYPACYLQIEDVEWEPSQNRHYEFGQEPQEGNCNIFVHVVYHTLKGFDRLARNEFFDVCDSVSNSLQRLDTGTGSTGSYSTLMRSGENYPTPNKQLRIGIIGFQTNLYDTFESPETTTATGVTITLSGSTI